MLKYLVDRWVLRSLMLVGMLLMIRICVDIVYLFFIWWNVGLFWWICWLRLVWINRFCSCFCGCVFCCFLLWMWWWWWWEWCVVLDCFWFSVLFWGLRFVVIGYLLVWGLVVFCVWGWVFCNYCWCLRFDSCVFLIGCGRVLCWVCCFLWLGWF